MDKFTGWIKNNPWLFAFWVLFSSVIGIFIYRSDANIQAALISFLGATGIAIYTNYQTKKREIKARHFTEKREGYKGFVGLIFKVIKATKNKKPLSDKNLQSDMLEFKKNILTWGGAEVIKELNDYETVVTTIQDPEERLKLMEGLLRAIREDLGHDDDSLEFGQLLSLILDEDGKKVFNKKSN